MIRLSFLKFTVNQMVLKGKYEKCIQLGEAGSLRPLGR